MASAECEVESSLPFLKLREISFGFIKTAAHKTNLILSVDRCPTLEQAVHTLDVPSGGCAVQGCFTVLNMSTINLFRYTRDPLIL